MCEVIETVQVIERRANGRVVRVENPKYWQVGVIQVDNCLITDTKRCDWMFRLPIAKKAISGTRCLKLVELKGSDVIYAFQQLRETIDHPNIASERSLINECFIVTQQRPELTPTIQIEKSNFLDDYGLHVRVVSVAIIDAIDG